jgi:hypothetical protein
MTRRYAKTRLLSLLEFKSASARLVAVSVKHKMTHLAKDSTTPGHVEKKRVDIVRSRREVEANQADDIVSTGKIRMFTGHSAGWPVPSSIVRLLTFILPCENIPVLLEREKGNGAGHLANNKT